VDDGKLPNRTDRVRLGRREAHLKAYFHWGPPSWKLALGRKNVLFMERQKASVVKKNWPSEWLQNDNF